MRPVLHRIFTIAVCVAFALTTLLLMALFLPPQDIRDGAWIFALAFVAVFIGIVRFARRNQAHLDHFVQHRDWSSLKAMVWRSRGK